MNSIRTLRKGKMTQDELAKSVGVTQAAVSEWEIGKSQPSADKLKAIARVLGVTVDALLSEPDHTSEQPEAAAPAPGAAA